MPKRIVFAGRSRKAAASSGICALMDVAGEEAATRALISSERRVGILRRGAIRLATMAADGGDERAEEVRSVASAAAGWMWSQ